MSQLRDLLTSLAEQADCAVIIDNASDEPVTADGIGHDVVRRWNAVAVINDAEQPPNLYRLWNVGLDVVREWCVSYDTWDVGLFNDDATVSVGWWDAMSGGLRTSVALIATTPAHQRLLTPLLQTAPDGNISLRMCPWAFVMKGESELRADENYRWWYGDTDLEWRARLSGGVLLMPGEVPGNTCANSTTVGELAEQAGRDGETFAAKWGRRPW